MIALAAVAALSYFDGKSAGDDTPIERDVVPGGSKDPRKYPHGWVPPVSHRQQGASNKRVKPPKLSHVEKHGKAGLFEKDDRNLTKADFFTPARVARSRQLRWQAINPDLPFTGANGSTRSYHLEDARRAVRQVRPGTSFLPRAQISLSQTVGDRPEGSRVGNEYFQPRYLYQHSVWSGNTPRVFDDYGEPHIEHLDDDSDDDD
jgi:hypothetical protein